MCPCDSVLSLSGVSHVPVAYSLLRRRILMVEMLAVSVPASSRFLLLHRPGRPVQRTIEDLAVRTQRVLRPGPWPRAKARLTSDLMTAKVARKASVWRRRTQQLVALCSREQACDLP